MCRRALFPTSAPALPETRRDVTETDTERAAVALDEVREIVEHARNLVSPRGSSVHITIDRLYAAHVDRRSPLTLPLGAAIEARNWLMTWECEFQTGRRHIVDPRSGPRVFPPTSVAERYMPVLNPDSPIYLDWVRIGHTAPLAQESWRWGRRHGS